MCTGSKSAVQTMAVVSADHSEGCSRPCTVYVTTVGTSGLTAAGGVMGGVGRALRGLRGSHAMPAPPQSNSESEKQQRDSSLSTRTHCADQFRRGPSTDDVNAAEGEGLRGGGEGRSCPDLSSDHGDALQDLAASASCLSLGLLHRVPPRSDDVTAVGSADDVTSKRADEVAARFLNYVTAATRADNFIIRRADDVTVRHADGVTVRRGNDVTAFRRVNALTRQNAIIIDIDSPPHTPSPSPSSTPSSTPSHTPSNTPSHTPFDLPPSDTLHPPLDTPTSPLLDAFESLRKALGENTRTLLRYEVLRAREERTRRHRQRHGSPAGGEADTGPGPLTGGGHAGAGSPRGLGAHSYCERPNGVMIGGAGLGAGVGVGAGMGAGVVGGEREERTKQKRSKVIVELRVVFLKIGEIDTLKEQYSADTYIQAKWREPALEGRGEEDLSRADLSSCWNPLLYIDNILSETKEVTWLSANENARGEVYVCERRRVRGVFMENLELNDFPLDVQDLTVTITSERPDTEVDIIPDEQEMSAINVQTFVDQQEWRLHEHIEVSRKLMTQEYTHSTRSHPALSVTCRAARRPGYFYWNVFLVMFFISALSFATFSVSPDLPQNRLQLSFTLLLTSVAFKFVINQSLPKISYLTYMDKYVLLSLVILCVVCIWHAVVTLFVPYGSLFLLAVERDVFVAFVVVYVLCHVVFALWLYFDEFLARKKEWLARLRDNVPSSRRQSALTTADHVTFGAT